MIETQDIPDITDTSSVESDSDNNSNNKRKATDTVETTEPIKKKRKLVGPRKPIRWSLKHCEMKKIRIANLLQTIKDLKEENKKIRKTKQPISKKLCITKNDIKSVKKDIAQLRSIVNNRLMLL